MNVYFKLAEYLYIGENVWVPTKDIDHLIWRLLVLPLLGTKEEKQWPIFMDSMIRKHAVIVDPLPLDDGEKMFISFGRTFPALETEKDHVLFSFVAHSSFLHSHYYSRNRDS
jgi:hypothetical protein